MESNVLNELVGNIYDCVTNDGWDDLNRRMANFVGAEVIHILLGDPYDPLIESAPNVDPEIGNEYRKHYAQIDLRTDRLKFAKSNELFREKQLLTNTEYKKSPIHQELFQKYDIFDLHSSTFNFGNTRGWVGFSASRSKNNFSSEDLAKMSLIVPHIARSFYLAKKNQNQKIGAAALLNYFRDRGPAKILLIKENGTHHLNNEAKSLREQNVFKIERANFVFFCRETQKKIIDFLGCSHKTTSRDFVYRDEETNQEFLIRVSKNASFKCTNSSQLVTVTEVTIVENAGAHTLELGDVLEFTKAFKLSPAEHEIVWSILNLKSTAEFAQERGIRIDTARKQLKAAFRKLNINSQKALLRKFEIAVLAKRKSP
jgi:DNA-binding CsgD family transcriptional regulator